MSYSSVFFFFNISLSLVQICAKMIDKLKSSVFHLNRYREYISSSKDI